MRGSKLIICKTYLSFKHAVVSKWYMILQIVGLPPSYIEFCTLDFDVLQKKKKERKRKRAREMMNEERDLDPIS